MVCRTERVERREAARATRRAAHMPVWAVLLLGVAGARQRGSEQVGLPPGVSPLMMAGFMGNSQIVDDLLTAGADINAKSSGDGIRVPHGATALMLASMKGHVDIVRRLLEAGAEFDVQNARGGSALMSASAGGHLGVVTLLCGVGARVDLRDMGGLTAEDWALRGGHQQVATRLRESPQQPALGEWVGVLVACAVFFAMSHRLALGALNGRLRARGRGNLRALVRDAPPQLDPRFLREAVKLNRPDALNLALNATAGAAQQAELLAAADRLLPSVPLLVLACRHGHTHCVRVLLQAGAHADGVPSGGGYSPLQAAAIVGHADCIRLLLAAGADTSLTSCLRKTALGGSTAMDFALEAGNFTCAALLHANDGGATRLGKQAQKRLARRLQKAAASSLNASANCAGTADAHAGMAAAAVVEAFETPGAPVSSLTAARGATSSAELEVPHEVDAARARRASDAGHESDNDTSASDEAHACVVCIGRPRTHAFVPCGHQCVCQKCCEAIMEQDGSLARCCPLCREPCRQAVRIYN